MGEWLSNLSTRDRRLLLAALPVIGVLVALVILRSLPASTGDPEERLTRALEDIAWLSAQQSRIAPVRCTAGDDLEAIASRHGVPLTLSEESDGSQRLTTDDVAGNVVVELVRELECAGYRLRQLDWVTQNDRGTVRGHLVLDRL